MERRGVRGAFCKLLRDRLADGAVTDAKLSSSVRSSISSASSTAAEALGRVRLANIAKGIVANSWAATGGNDFQIDVEATNGYTASSIFSSDGASFWRDGKKMWLK